MKLIIQLTLLSVVAYQLVAAIETPKYQLLQKLDENIEIRKYEPTKWVATKMTAQVDAYQTSTLFGKLFSYISGNNDAQQKIDMTAPVLNYMKSLNGQLINRDSMVEITMGFYVPKVNQPYTPNPNADDVFIQREPEETFAVIRFSGYASINDFIKQRDVLIEALGSEAVNYDTVNMLTAGYSAPFVVVGRINEVWLKKF
jgi:hypothetical protein